jgi:hypothetical protein
MPIPADKKLYEKIKKKIYAVYKVPSAYRSGAVVKEYKKQGGTYLGNQKKSDGLTRWFREQWADVGNKAYPVYRPTIRVTKDTPLTVSEIKPSDLKKKIKVKQKIKSSKNLSPFMRK